jgi:alpha-L-arabinofuranosidase
VKGIDVKKHSRSRRIRWGGTALITGLGLVAGALTAQAAPAETVTVTPGRTLGTVSPLLLGADGRWEFDGAGSWNPHSQAAYPGFTQAVKNTGVTVLRYPSGTEANLYHWKQAIGPVKQRVDQVHGATGQPVDNDFGPDEWGRQAEALGQRMTMVVNFATGTPQEAADFVEYMTGVVGQNLNGGTDWAAVRAANGHPKPYDVSYWEVGNEMALRGQKYWRDGASAKDQTALYVRGGSTTFTKQRVGKHSDYRPSAAISTGRAGQRFVAKYAPVTPGTAHVFVGGKEWQRVDELSNSAANAHVFTLTAKDGTIAFGDGRNGAVPPKESVVTISYTSGPHAGFEDFYAQMKRANPRIKVCDGLDDVDATVEFTRLMGTQHPYDCIERHAYIKARIDTHVGVAEYHSRVMLQVGNEIANLKKIQRAVRGNAGAHASRVQVVASEYGQLGDGHPDNDPDYHAGLSQALLMANFLEEFIKLGIPLAEKSHLTDYVFAPPPAGSTSTSKPLNAMIAGPGLNFVVQPTGLVPNLFTPLAGETAITTSVTNHSPYRLDNGQSMPSLTAVASRAHNGGLDLLVVNQNPKDNVTTFVRPSIAHGATAQVSTLTGPAVDSRNLPGHDQVKITSRLAKVGSDGFTYTFPAHSITRILLSTT